MRGKRFGDGLNCADYLSDDEKRQAVGYSPLSEMPTS